MRMLALACGLVTALACQTPKPVSAYPVDCAILLCLAGGWPASAVCSHARAVFIERITPFPIEPPLQIWNCPMRAALFRKPAWTFIWSVGFDSSQNSPEGEDDRSPVGLYLGTDQADIDISDPSYDFVRSIRVFHIRYSMRRSSGGSCTSSSTIEKGVYGTQGDFKWTESSLGEVPSASKLKTPVDCENYFYRSVLVEWRGSSGGYGREEVQY